MKIIASGTSGKLFFPGHFKDQTEHLERLNNHNASHNDPLRQQCGGIFDMRMLRFSWALMVFCSLLADSAGLQKSNLVEWKIEFFSIFHLPQFSFCKPGESGRRLDVLMSHKHAKDRC